MERQDYEQMVEEMRIKCISAFMYVKDFCELTPPSVQCHLQEYADIMLWEFKLPDNEKERPYLTWSLGQDHSMPWVRGRLDYLVTVCYGRGEFGFYPHQASSPIRILRRTPRGWGMQEETLVDELCSIAKSVPRCDISALLRHITDTFLKVPTGLRTLIQEKTDSLLGEDARFLLSKALSWRDCTRLADQEKKVREELMRMFLAEMRGIEHGLEGTKSFTKSKVLRAIRERCKRLGHNVEGMLPEYTTLYE